MKKIIFFLILNSTFLIFNSVCSGRNRNSSDEHSRTIDSLLFLLKTDKPDTNKVIHSYKLCWEYTNIGLYDTALNYGNSALKIAEQLLKHGGTPEELKGIKKCIARSYNNIGVVYKEQGNYSQALDFYLKALKLYEEYNDLTGIAKCCGNIGGVLEKQSNYSKALDYYFKALKIFENLGDKNRIAINLNNIGNVYCNQGAYPKSLEYYFRSLKMADDLGNKQLQSSTLGNIGVVYADQANYTKASDYYFKALKIDEKLGNKNGIAIKLGSIGNVYFKQKDYPKALEYYFKSLKMSEELGAKNGIAIKLGNIGMVYAEQAGLLLQHGNTTEANLIYTKALDHHFKALKMAEEMGDKNGIARHLGNIGSVYTSTKKYSEAEKYLQKALALSYSIGDLVQVMDGHQNISNLYKQKGDYHGTLEHYKKAMVAKDSLFNQEKNKDITRKEMNYEFEKIEVARKAEQEKKDIFIEAEHKRQQLLLWLLIAVAFAIAVIAAIVFRSSRITKKQNQYIESQKNLVERQNMEITIQKQLVEEKNKNIEDSVSYAQRIQSSFLTSEAYIKRYLPEYFILYQPREVVSGDFYWMHQQGDYLYFCIADCTGHGIPGAFMSLIGMGVLNEIVYSKQIKDTNEILDELRRIVILAVNPEGALVERKDGMDLVLCRLHLKTKELQYSTANNSFYIYKNGEFMKHKTDMMPIGKFGEFENPFSHETIQLKTGDIIYASTDGLRDQFGGKQGKKFMAKRFEESILSITQSPLAEQKEMLEKEFMEWKGNEEQVDDVCVFGVRI